MKVLFSAVIVALLVSGCSTPAVISDIDDSSLKVQGGMGTTENDYYAKAKEGCSLYNKKPVRISHVCIDAYCTRKSVLFACK